MEKQIVAIPFENGEIFQHFGKASAFKLYTLEGLSITNSEVVKVEGSGHDEIGLWLVWHAVTTVICGTIGPGAMGVLVGAGIKVFPGLSGATDTAITALIDGSLVAQLQSTCSHSCHSCHGCHGCHGHSA